VSPQGQGHQSISVSQGHIGHRDGQHHHRHVTEIDTDPLSTIQL